MALDLKMERSNKINVQWTYECVVNLFLSIL
jgi:hypothetical protein